MSRTRWKVRPDVGICSWGYCIPGTVGSDAALSIGERPENAIAEETIFGEFCTFKPFSPKAPALLRDFRSQNGARRDAGRFA